MIRDILLLHHSHTDVGYTHPQPVVLELHRRYIDQALDLAERTADWPENSRFKWTCEVTGTALDWWRSADDHQRRRFLNATQAGQLEVAGLNWNATPLMDHQMLLGMLESVKFFRSLGVPVRYAMSSDVNGLPWGTVDALLDHGIEGVSMAINEHFGHAPQPCPRGFYWQAPSGRKILAYNGLIYGGPVGNQLKIPKHKEGAKEAIPKYLKLWEERGYPYPFLMLQATNPGIYDNAPPDLKLCHFIRDWN